LKAPPARTLLFAWGLAVASIAVLFLLYRDTLQSVISIWDSSETYAHGWIIVPLVAWLIWRERERLRVLRPRFNPLGLVAMGVAALLWLAADIVGVQVVQHFTLVAFVWSVVLTLLGAHVFRVLWFPMAFLVFAVPFGEMLIPTLMEITAWFSINAVRLTGIPVYRDGMFFALPSGDFEIAVACSGIRYLIASVALGTLYAYLSFHTWWKRIAFSLLAIVVPIVANGIRAYIIVMLAHLSDMRLAVGIDHFIYGWVFFGIVMFILFMIGARFQEPESERPPIRQYYDAPSPLPVIAVAALALIGIGFMVPAAADRIGADAAAEQNPLYMPVAQGGWSGPLPVATDYRPSYQGASTQAMASYENGRNRVSVFVEYFDAADAEAELINDLNRVYGNDWIREDIGVRVQVAPGHRVIATPVRRGREELIVWHWYEVNAGNTVSGTRAKLVKLRDTLLGRFRGAAMVALVASVDSTPEQTEAALQAFADSHLARLRSCLHDQSATDCVRQ
ncbi:MAG: exosortase A, partial [Gammaproteobacteria bacterium]|nr:exosortase A [Gammaproteobacteria bacterium]